MIPQWPGAIALLLAFGANLPAPGVTCTIRMTLRPPPSAGDSAIASLVTRGSFTRTGARLEIIDQQPRGGGDESYAIGDYLLKVDSLRWLLVKPAAGKNQESQVGPALTDLGSQYAELGKVSGVSVRLEKLGASDTIAGRPTQHYRISASYSAVFMESSLLSRTVIDTWQAQLPATIWNPFNGLLPQPEPDVESLRDFSRKFSAAKRQIPGSSLKAVVTSAVVTPDGRSVEMSMTSEVTEIKSGDVADSLFRMPKAG